MNDQWLSMPVKPCSLDRIFMQSFAIDEYANNLMLWFSFNEAWKNEIIPEKLHSNNYPKIDGGMNKCSSFLYVDPKMSCLYVSQN